MTYSSHLFIALDALRKIQREEHLPECGFEMFKDDFEGCLPITPGGMECNCPRLMAEAVFATMELEREDW